MAYSEISYATDGNTDTFSVPFSYINKSDITVYLNDVSVYFEWVTSQTIKVVPTPSAGLVVKITRSTRIDQREVDYQGGTVLTEHTLDKDSQQAFFLIQEMRDDIEDIEAGMLGQTTIDEITSDAADSAENQVLNSSTIATLQNDVATAQATADSKVVTFYQNTAPSGQGEAEGDLWFDTDGGNKLYRYESGSWVDVQDQDIIQALNDAASAQATADGKIVTYYQDAEPSGGSEGDLWFDTDDDNKLYRHNGTSWVDAASSASGINITQSATAPSNPNNGDIWYDSDDYNKSYQWDGSQWQPLVTEIDGSLIVTGSIVGDKINAGEIGANHLSVNQLDAISADLGSITAGSLTLQHDGTHRIEVSSNDYYPLWYGSGSKNAANAEFYLDKNGNAVFKGQLSAATGTFSGDLSASGGTFAGTLSAADGTFEGSLTANAVNAVDTVNVAGNAITVPDSASQTSNISAGDSAWKNVASVTWSATGGTITAIGGADVEGSVAYQDTGDDWHDADLRININGQVGPTVRGRDVFPAGSGFIDSVFNLAGHHQRAYSGNASVTLQVRSSGGNGSTIKNGWLYVVEAKR